MSETKSDTVPGLGFKDKEKALETIKNLEGRDPDYQRLAIKGLIGRAKRTLTVTKDKEKLQNINDALKVFEEWLQDFEVKNLSKENRAYLPFATIETLLSLKKKYEIKDKKAEAFLEAYKSAGGDYKNLRTVSSGENGLTWDIVRNTELRSLLKSIEENKPEMWKDDVPTKEHLNLILWAYSLDATRIKKNLSKIEEKIGDAGGGNKDSNKKSSKRKSDSSDSSSEEESPKKKNKSSE